jgi:molecular chaperone GrpE
MTDKNNIDDNTVEEVVEENNNDITEENLQKLGAEILRLREELTAKDDLIMREKAENQNLRSRHARELDDKGKFAIGEFSKDLVEVMESLYRALQFKEEFDISDSKIAGMFDGIDMTLKLLEKSFTKYGVKRVYPLNEQFDHKYHQAISKVTVVDKGNNEIVDVIQAGYVIHDRLLKPALVIVNVEE